MCDFFFRIATSTWFSCLFRIINVYQCFFTLNILFDDDVVRGLWHEKKIVRYHLKIITDDLN